MEQIELLTYKSKRQWWKTIITTCYVCGGSYQTRKAMFTEKPSYQEDRVDRDHSYYCGCEDYNFR